MNANRFFSVSFDIRHNPKVEMLSELQGGRMAALGRWVALLSLLYDEGGSIMLDSDLKRRYLARELELDCEGLDGFLDDCAEVGLIELAAWADRRTVCSFSVVEEIAYRQAKSEAGKAGGRPRKAKK